MTSFSQDQDQFKEVSCAVCESSDDHTLYHLSDKRIVVCNRCGLERVNPISMAAVQKPYVLRPLVEMTLGTKIDLCYLEKVFRKYRLWNCRLLDLGCGEGRLEQGLVRGGWDEKHLYLLDFAEDRLNAARAEFPSAHFALQDIEESISFDECFDCVIMVEFLEHVIDPGRVVRNALNALRPGGLLVVRAMPNNESVEAFIGRDKWKMRVLDQHHYFFNPRTFSCFLKNFAEAELLEFGCFLQEGYRFYNIVRIAKDIGLSGWIKHVDSPQSVCRDRRSEGEIADRVLAELQRVDFGAYAHRARLPMRELAALSTVSEIETFFDEIHLDYLLAPDFSAVIRKAR